MGTSWVSFSSTNTSASKGLSGAIEHILSALKRTRLEPSWTILLEVGCGSSCLAHSLRRLGYRHVLASDFSPAALEGQHMESTLAQSSMELCLLNCCSLNLRESCFNIVVDKGTLDAIDCSGNTCAAIAEICRILRPDGWYLLASCRDPRDRKHLLAEHFKLLDIVELQQQSSSALPCPDYYLYILRKGR